MKRKLIRIDDSRGVALPPDILDLLGLNPGGEVEILVVGNTMIMTAGDADPAELEAALAYLKSKHEREALYRKLTDA